LAIVDTIRRRWHSLGAAINRVIIRYNRNNVELFDSCRVLPRTQGSRSTIFTPYDIVIELWVQSMNSHNGPCRQHNYDIIYDKPTVRLLATAGVKPSDDFIPAIVAAQALDCFPVEVSAMFVEWPVVDRAEIVMQLGPWKIIAGAW